MPTALFAAAKVNQVQYYKKNTSGQYKVRIRL